ncbi:MAG: DUF2752 domain-containing protein [Bacteroidetes bacterium]|nr:DUF2752 domain-containing protein [Bacteroidota bacterium]
MTRKNLYFLALFLGLAGQIWIVYSYKKLERQEEAFNTCIFRRVTGLPCPSCGTVHSIVSIVHGNFRQALNENPLGYLGFPIVLIIPWWILADLAFGRESFYNFYLRSNKFLNHRWVLFSILSVIFLLWLFKLGHFLHWI